MLNDAKIKAAKPRDKAYKLSDSGQLYLFVSPTGSRLWRMNYSFRPNPSKPSRQKTLSLGAYPRITLAEARKLRDEAKALLADGVDPSTHKQESALADATQRSHTFEAVAREWHEIQLPRWSKVHAKDVLRSLEENVFPEIGDMPISEIKAPRLLEVLRKIEARGAIETAHRVRSRMSSAFVFAIASGIHDSDPAASLGKALRPVPRTRAQPAIVDLDGVKTMLTTAEAERCRAGTKLALRLLALTAVRPGELRFARWAEFDLNGDEPLWTIPAERMKGTDARKHEVDGDHLVPLSRQAVDVLECLKRLSGDLELVFPSERHVHRPISENTIRALLIRAGYYQRHVPHGFRAAFSTIMNERVKEQGKGEDRAIIDLMLAHVPKDKVEGAYNRAAYMPRRREIAQEWADLIADDLVPPEAHLGQPIRYAATGPGK